MPDVKKPQEGGLMASLLKALLEAVSKVGSLVTPVSVLGLGIMIIIFGLVL